MRLSVGLRGPRFFVSECKGIKFFGTHQTFPKLFFIFLFLGGLHNYIYRAAIAIIDAIAIIVAIATIAVIEIIDAIEIIAAKGTRATTPRGKQSSSLLFSLSGEVEEGFGKVAIAGGILVEVVLVIVLGTVKIAEREFLHLNQT